VIRLAWRQFRAEAAVTAGALLVVAVALAVTGPSLVHVFRHAPRQLATTDHLLQTAVYALSLLSPALLGIFFGAPLVAREIETGTFRLAWTQSVSRVRWLVMKLVFVGLAASAVAGGFSLMAAWWANPINIFNANRFDPANFGVFGIVPFGYAIFAFTPGATTGLLFRRTLPAMATTLVGYVGARLAVTYWVRPHFATPLHMTVALLKAGGYGFSRSTSGALSVVGFPPNIPNAWPLSASIVDRAGHVPTSQYLARTCPTLLTGPGKAAAGGRHTSAFPGGGPQTCIAHLAARFHEVVTYQPAARYWPFQIAETALFVVLAAALAALSVWWVRRRLV
jgi:hypothetical protein